MLGFLDYSHVDTMKAKEWWTDEDFDRLISHVTALDAINETLRSKSTIKPTVYASGRLLSNEVQSIKNGLNRRDHKTLMSLIAHADTVHEENLQLEDNISRNQSQRSNSTSSRSWLKQVMGLYA